MMVVTCNADNDNDDIGMCDNNAGCRATSDAP
jgi:hypothetical protein